MTAWSEMSPIVFDATLAPSARARRFVQAAPGTLFPSLLPEPKRKTTQPAGQLDGQVSIFDLEDE